MKHKDRFRNLYVKACMIIFAAGVMVILYPYISSVWNSHTQSKAISGYNEKLHETEKQRYETLKQEAIRFNEEVIYDRNAAVLTQKEMEQYESMLKVDESGMLGFIDIPSINTRLPIYRGTDENALSSGAGHVEWSSLPLGGENTHCVISGHSGMSGVRLFDDLVKMKKNERFYVHVLDEVLVYEVIRIETCLPQQSELLSIEDGKDLCTLVTCTPYGINSHRLLVTGERVRKNEIPAEKTKKQNSTPTVMIVLCLTVTGSLLYALNRRRKKQINSADGKGML